MSQSKEPSTKATPNEEELRQAKIKALKKERAAQNAKTKKELLELGEEAPKKKASPKKTDVPNDDAKSDELIDIDAKIKELSARLNAIKREEKG